MRGLRISSLSRDGPSINQNLTFRAHRYPSEFPAFQSVMLEPQGVLELDPPPCGGAIAGCLDPLACNYDETATTADSCVYFDPSYGTSLDFVIGVLEPELGCNRGYAVSESLPLTLEETESGYTWSIDDEVAQILIDNGFGIVVNDLTTQTLSLCGNA